MLGQHKKQQQDLKETLACAVWQLFEQPSYASVYPIQPQYSTYK